MITATATTAFARHCENSVTQV